MQVWPIQYALGSWKAFTVFSSNPLTLQRFTYQSNAGFCLRAQCLMLLAGRSDVAAAKRSVDARDTLVAMREIIVDMTA